MSGAKPSATKVRSPKRGPKKTKLKPIVRRAQQYIEGHGWGPAAKGGSKLPPKMKALIAKDVRFHEADAGRQVVKKEWISAKTGKPVKSVAGQRKVSLRLTYADLSTYNSKPFKPTKAEVEAFKGIKLLEYESAAKDAAMAPDQEVKKLVFSRCLDIAAGGPIGTTRDAVAKLLGSFTFPPKGLFEMLVYWRVYADKTKAAILDAPPSKRFIVDAAAMKAGYGKFLQHLMDLKTGDLEDEMGLDLDELRAEKPEVLRAFIRQLRASKDLPRNSTRAFLEKQILAMAQGRGMYISDKSMFKDYHSKGKKRKKAKKAKQQAAFSELCIRVWEMKRKARPVKGKKTAKRRGKT